MQIVMKLAGYSLGRSDLVRRAMSKKKADVMAKEREYFVYGNEELGFPAVSETEWMMRRRIRSSTRWLPSPAMHLTNPMLPPTR